MSELNKHLINLEEAKILQVEYDRTNYVAINEARSAGKPDSKYYTFELEVLQQYIDLMRQELDKRGVPEKGIRVHLGKYPINDFSEKLNPAYRGYQTVFFTGVDLKSDSEYYKNSGEDGEEELPGFNFGQLCPP